MNVFCAEYSTRAIRDELCILIGQCIRISYGRCVDKFVPKSVKWDKAGWIVNNKYAFFILDKSTLTTQKSYYVFAHAGSIFAYTKAAAALYTNSLISKRYQWRLEPTLKNGA